MDERLCEAVGIDLGTTYSSLAYMDQQMMPRVVNDSNGQSVMPSVVFFDDNEIVVGDVALSQAKVNAERIVQFIKVHMGENWRKTFGGQVHSPESISALIIGQLVREAEQQIGGIRRAVITVPAYFTEKRRRATQQAGEIAGLDVLGTLNEPMSAALAYGLHRTDREQFAVVYDLGGGTFDVTVVRITPNELEEIATSGNRQLGGRDWDQVLVDLICQEFISKHRDDPRHDLQAFQDLLLECEKAKRRLTRMAKTSIRLHAFGHDHTVELTREQFESESAHLLQATKLTTELALEDANLDWRKISRVVLVGGSTNMPAVRTMLKRVSGLQPAAEVNPVVAVALGAATYAHMLESGEAIKQIRLRAPAPDSTAENESPRTANRLPAPQQIPNTDLRLNLPQQIQSQLLPKVKFVTAHGVGIKTRNVAGEWCNTVLIPRNSPVPVKVSRRFATKADNSGATSRVIGIDITQGDSPQIELAEILGTGRIDLPAAESAGNPVQVTMEFDFEGRLHTHAVYVKSGQEMRMTVEVQGGLRQDEVDTYKQLLRKSGFCSHFSVEQSINNVEDSEDMRIDDGDDLPMIEPA